MRGYLAFGRAEKLAAADGHARGNVARTVLLGSPGPSPPSPVLDEPFSRYFRLLDLPPKLLPTVLSFIFLGALSDRQLLSVLQHAADRITLLPQLIVPEPHTLQPSTRAQLVLDQEPRRRLPFEQEIEFLDEMGCYRYDR